MSKVASNLLKALLKTTVVIYTLIILFDQESAIKSLNNEQIRIERQKEEAEFQTIQLEKERDIIGTEEYIIKNARELGLCFPNETEIRSY